jgi:hypothetical protein
MAGRAGLQRRYRRVCIRSGWWTSCTAPTRRSSRPVPPPRATRTCPAPVLSWPLSLPSFVVDDARPCSSLLDNVGRGPRLGGSARRGRGAQARPGAFIQTYGKEEYLKVPPPPAPLPLRPTRAQATFPQSYNGSNSFYPTRARPVRAARLTARAPRRQAAAPFLAEGGAAAVSSQFMRDAQRVRARPPSLPFSRPLAPAVPLAPARARPPAARTVPRAAPAAARRPAARAPTGEGRGRWCLWTRARRTAVAPRTRARRKWLQEIV